MLRTPSPKMLRTPRVCFLNCSFLFVEAIRCSGCDFLFSEARNWGSQFLNCFLRMKATWCAITRPLPATHLRAFQGRCWLRRMPHVYARAGLFRTTRVVFQGLDVFCVCFLFLMCWVTWMFCFVSDFSYLERTTFFPYILLIGVWNFMFMGLRIQSLLSYSVFSYSEGGGCK